MRKPRSDSKLEALNQDQKRQLCEWLLSGLFSYSAIKKMVEDEFKVSTSAAALSSFYQQYASAYLIQRRREAVGVAREVGQEIQKTPGQFSQATIDALEQKAFELANNPMVNPKDVKNIFSLVLKAQDQSLKQQDISIKLRRLELLEKKVSEARAMESDSKLSAAEKAQRIREIFKQ